MLDRRQLVLAGIAGLIVPARALAQPGGGGAGGPGGPGGSGPAAGPGGLPGNAPGQNARPGAQQNERREQAGAGGQVADGEQAPQPPRIHALILSQSYQASPGLTLANTTRDAALIARSFQRLRFDSVVAHRDGSTALTMAYIAAFLRTIDANTIALLYVAGHGVEIGGENLLLLESGDSFLSLQALVQLLQQRAGVTILFLDACRNNPFGNVAAAISEGRVARAIPGEREEIGIETVSLSELRAAPNETLGRLRAFSLQGSGIKIVFSTDPANVAFDAARPSSRNSPFAEALARHIRQPVSLDDIVALTTGDVLRATRRVQSPWSQSSIDRPIFLSGRGRRQQAAFR